MIESEAMSNCLLFEYFSDYIEALLGLAILVFGTKFLFWILGQRNTEERLGTPSIRRSTPLQVDPLLIEELERLLEERQIWDTQRQSVERDDTTGRGERNLWAGTPHSADLHFEQLQQFGTISLNDVELPCEPPIVPELAGVAPQLPVAGLLETQGFRHDEADWISELYMVD